MTVLTRSAVPVTATITGGTDTSGDSNYNAELDGILSLLDGTGDFDVEHKQGLVVNKAAGNFDTQFRGQTDANTLYVDASADSVGVGTDAPLAKLHVDAPNDTAIGLYQILDSTSATPADNDTRTVEYRQRNDGGANVPYASVSVTALDVTSGTEKGKVTWSVADGVDGSVDPVVDLEIGLMAVTGDITSTGSVNATGNLITAGDLELTNGQVLETYTAGETIAANDALRFAGSQVFKTDNTSQAGIENFVGLAFEAATVGNPIKVSTKRVTGLSGLTGGNIQYLSAAGAITTTRPVNGYVRMIGFAESATVLKIQNVPESIYRPKVVHRVWLPQNKNDFTGGSFQRVFDYESTPSQPAFHNEVMADYDIRLILGIEGSASPPFQFSIRFITDAAVVRFESNAIVLGNQSAQEMSWIQINLTTGNVVNWDPVNEILGGLNSGDPASTPVAWEVQINANVGGGAYRIHQMYVMMQEKP